MNTLEINKQMSNLSCFKGTFAINNIPNYEYKERPLALIINTDPITKPGEHWVALFIDENNNAEYLDSFGFNPINVYKFLKKNNVKSITFNKFQLQSIFTESCGAYCILFIKMRCNKMSYTSFLNLFSSNNLNNDLLVTRIVV